MFNWFKKEDIYTKKIIATSKQVKQAGINEQKFLKKAKTCPECGFADNISLIRYEGNGKKYTVPMQCSVCQCKWEYERPYKFE